MKRSRMKKLATRLLKNTYVQAALVGLLLILPIAVYVSMTHRIIAPLNVMPGWSIPADQRGVVANIPSDVNQQMLPFRQYVKDSLTQDHQLPLWNSRSFGGDIFLANPINTALSPLNFLLLFVDIYTFQNIIVLLGLFLMAGAMYLLVRQLKFSLYAGVIGAIAFTYAPFSVFWSIYGVISIPMAFIPFVLFLYYRWRDHPKRFNPYLLALSLSLGIVVYLGHIQIAILPYGVLSLAVIYDLVTKSLKPRKLLFLAGGILVGLIITLGQLVPMLLQTPESHRANEITAVDPKPWPARAEELFRVASPYNLVSGPTDLGVSVRRELTVGQIPGILFLVSIPILIILLVRHRAREFPFFFLFIFVFGAFWQWADFPQTLLNVISPTFRSLANDYFLPIALFGMAVLAAYTLDWILKLFFKKEAHEKYGLIVPLLIVIFIAFPQLQSEKIAELHTHYYVLYYLTIILSLSIYVWLRKAKRAKLYFAGVIIVAALMQGWALYRASQPLVSPNVLTVKNQLLQHITDEDKTTPTIVDYSGPQESVLYKVGLINGYDSLYSDSIQYRIRAINYPNETPDSYRNNSLIINSKTKTTLFKNLGVQYTMNESPTEGYVQQVEGVFKADQSTPRVYFASAIRNQSRTEQLESLKSGDVNYHEVAVDGEYRVADPSSTVTYTFGPNNLTLNTTSPDGGLLFIAQTYNKDWEVKLENNSKLELVPAYYDFSAIQVPKGTHTIILTYKPNLTIASITLSFIAILTVVAIFIHTVATPKSKDHKRKTRRQ